LDWELGFCNVEVWNLEVGRMCFGKSGVLGSRIDDDLTVEAGIVGLG